MPSKLKLAFWVSLLCASGAAGAAFADEAPNLKALFESGKYEDAAKFLESHPGRDANYYYNLGTVDYRLGRLGLAVAYLEKSNRLQPHDAATQQNLRAARTALGRLIGDDRLDPASSSFESIADHVALDEVRGALGLGCLILALFWIRSYLKTRSLSQTLLRPGGFLGICGLAIILSLYAAERIAASHPPAIALDRQSIRSGPGDQFVELSQLETGCKIRLLGPEEKSEHGGELWYQVRYSAGGIGWLRASSVLLL